MRKVRQATTSQAPLRIAANTYHEQKRKKRTSNNRTNQENNQQRSAVISYMKSLNSYKLQTSELGMKRKAQLFVVYKKHTSLENTHKLRVKP